MKRIENLNKILDEEIDGVEMLELKIVNLLIEFIVLWGDIMFFFLNFDFFEVFKI